MRRRQIYNVSTLEERHGKLNVKPQRTAVDGEQYWPGSGREAVSEVGGAVRGHGDVGRQEVEGRNEVQVVVIDRGLCQSCKKYIRLGLAKHRDRCDGQRKTH